MYTMRSEIQASLERERVNNRNIWNNRNRESHGFLIVFHIQLLSKATFKKGNGEIQFYKTTKKALGKWIVYS